MQSMLGWTLLSRDAVRQAEKFLDTKTQGVRDEIGFLELHQGYSDRFFPGTSVLQTRLRYVLFIPWIYNDLFEHTPNRPVGNALQDAETHLAGQLKASGDEGVIGERIYPRPAVYPPSVSYWSALGAWGILAQENGVRWMRSVVHHQLNLRRGTRSRGPRRDDEGRALERMFHPFVELPDPPEKWQNLPVLDFTLAPREAQFLREYLSAVPKKLLFGLEGAAAAPSLSLLARMVQARLTPDPAVPLWEAIAGIAGAADREALRRAEQVSALVGVGRGVYFAMLEGICRDEGLTDSVKHRHRLEWVVQHHGKAALELDVAAVELDLPSFSASMRRILSQTHEWLSGGRKDIFALHELYAMQEFRRKGSRARLPRTLAGRTRRLEWAKIEVPPAQVLHYWWKTVCQLLADLEG